MTSYKFRRLIQFYRMGESHIEQLSRLMSPEGAFRPIQFVWPNIEDAVKAAPGYLQTNSTTLQSVRSHLECGNRKGEDWAGLQKPTYDDCLSLRNGRFRPARLKTGNDPKRPLSC
jgi:hypothetical protein